MASANESANTRGEIERVSVIGAGTMGYGIALAYATGGHEVTLYDIDETALERAESTVRSGLATLAAAGRLTDDGGEEVEARLTYEPDFERAVERADFVTEAVAEDVAVKEETFARLDEHAPSEAILATNTSGLSITEIASAVADPARVLGTHWFNPAHVVPGVEVVYGEATADETVDVVVELLRSIGKTPIVVERDIRGFIGNRIQLAMCHEAFSLLEAGVADAETIDRAVKATFGFRVPAMGIFEKIDQSGLDVHRDVTEYLVPDLDRGTEPQAVMNELVAAGKLGVKTGEGLFDWRDREIEEIYEERDRKLLALLDAYETNEPVGTE